MPNQNRTLEEELAEQGVVASYIWRPNRLSVRDGDTYRAVDVVSDGSAEDVAAAVTAAGEQKIGELTAAYQQQVARLAQSENEFANVKSNLISTYTRMMNYFDQQGIPSLYAMMATAITNLNAL